MAPPRVPQRPASAASLVGLPLPTVRDDEDEMTFIVPPLQHPLQVSHSEELVASPRTSELADATSADTSAFPGQQAAKRPGSGQGNSVRSSLGLPPRPRSSHGNVRAMPGTPSTTLAEKATRGGGSSEDARPRSAARLPPRPRSGHGSSLSAAPFSHAGCVSQACSAPLSISSLSHIAGGAERAVAVPCGMASIQLAAQLLLSLLLTAC